MQSEPEPFYILTTTILLQQPPVNLGRFLSEDMNWLLRGKPIPSARQVGTASFLTDSTIEIVHRLKVVGCIAPKRVWHGGSPIIE